ncbi:MAG: acylphosphatase [Nocardioides sp.]
MRALRVQVHGAVQGVMFRDSCRREADRLGVTGWVRNEPDGSVTGEFEGDAVRDLVAWCHTGPRGARVDRVDVTEVEPSGLSGFEVRW